MTVLDTTSATPTHPAAPAAPAPSDDLAGVEEEQLRALRTSLVEETLRLRRWQRLVQARLDLATDRLSPAEALLGVDRAPCAAGQAAVPDAAGPADLVALVRGQVAGVTDAADDLLAVVTTHRVLRTRAVALAERLAAVDAALGSRGTGRRCCPRG